MEAKEVLQQQTRKRKSDRGEHQVGWKRKKVETIIQEDEEEFFPEEELDDLFSNGENSAPPDSDDIEKHTPPRMQHVT